jgi:predicted cobalt transporter CbtA
LFAPLFSSFLDGFAGRAAARSAMHCCRLPPALPLRPDTKARPAIRLVQKLHHTHTHTHTTHVSTDRNILLLAFKKNKKTDWLELLLLNYLCNHLFGSLKVGIKDPIVI